MASAAELGRAKLYLTGGSTPIDLMGGQMRTMKGLCPRCMKRVRAELVRTVTDVPEADPEQSLPAVFNIYQASERALDMTTGTGLDIKARFRQFRPPLAVLSLATASSRLGDAALFAGD